MGDDSLRKNSCLLGRPNIFVRCLQNVSSSGRNVTAAVCRRNALDLQRQNAEKRTKGEKIKKSVCLAEKKKKGLMAKCRGISEVASCMYVAVTGIRQVPECAVRILSFDNVHLASLV